MQTTIADKDSFISKRCDTTLMLKTFRILSSGSSSTGVTELNPALLMRTVGSVLVPGLRHVKKGKFPTLCMYKEDNCGLVLLKLLVITAISFF